MKGNNMPQFDYILAFAIAFIVAFFMTPLVRKLAFQIGAVDVPKDERRMHKEPVARLGGLAIFIGFLVSIGYYLINNFIDTGSLKLDIRFQGILIGSLMIIAIGIIDDIKPLRPWIKLLVQVIAALTVVMTGTQIEEITNPFSSYGMTSLGMLSIPLTVIWIIGITNAINLIDGLDGLAAGVSSIALLSLLFISIFEQQYGVVYVVAALAGGTLGFLPFNFNPAKIFMGDS
ncbi:MAG: glycosyltransferase family 4 protein, partial [Chloroflexota bacterium]